MEKDGWLDQGLLWILDLLNQQWLSIMVATAGAFAVAYLGKMSPKEDWKFLEEGPGRVLLVAFFVLGSLKSAPRLILPETHFVCDREPGVLGITVTTDCRMETVGEFQTVYDYTLANFAGDFAKSLLYDFIFGAIGGIAGLLVALIVIRQRNAPLA